MLLPADSDQPPLTQQVTMLQIQNRIKSGINLLAEITANFHAVIPMKKYNPYIKCMQVRPTSALSSSLNFMDLLCQSLVSQNYVSKHNADFCIIWEPKRFHKPKWALGQNLSCKIYPTNTKEREYQYQARVNLTLLWKTECIVSFQTLLIFFF